MSSDLGWILTAFLGLSFVTVQAADNAAQPAASKAEKEYQTAVSYLAQGRLRLALPHLEESYRLGLRHTALVLQLARCRLAAGQDAEAVSLLKGVVRSATSPNLLLQVGRLLFDRVLYREALIPLEKAWRLEPSSYEAGMYLALAYYLLERYQTSEAVLSAMRPQSTAAMEYLNLLGAVNARLARWDKAKAQFEEAIHRYPERGDAYLSLGLLYLEGAEEQKAMEWIERGAERLQPGTKVLYTLRRRANCAGLQPPFVGPTQDLGQARLYNSFALSLQKMQHWQSALEVYLLALKTDPSSAAAYGGIGLICQELGTPEQGKLFLEQGVRLHPDDSELHYYLGSVYQALGAFEQGIRHHQTAIDLKNGDAPSRYFVRLGMTQVAAEDERTAEASFLRAIEKDPNSAPAHYELGKLYLKRRLSEQAERSLERAVDLDPLMRQAWYAYGLACVRNGKMAQGKAILESYQRTKELRDTKAPGGSEQNLTP